jgi:citrate synthase
LGCGPVLVGTAERCAALLVEAQRRIEGGEAAAPVVESLVRDCRSRGEKVPGFGHPVHKPLDPRAERILELAAERGVAAGYVALALAFREAVAQVWGKPLVMNVSMPIAAVLLDLGFPAHVVKAIPLLARTASILAHLGEEQQHPVGFHMAHHGEMSVRYQKPQS